MLVMIGHSSIANANIYTDIINGLTLNQIMCRTYNICKPGDLGYVNYETPASASFNASTVSGQTPLTVEFTNTSKEARNSYVHNELTYLWDFGDGSTDFSKNPVHTYASGGMYVAKLTITDPRGHTNSYSTNITAINLAASGASWRQITCFFDWSEENYSNSFPKGSGVLSMWPPYTFRFYGGTNYYLAVSSQDNNLYYMSGQDGVIHNVGDIGKWLSASGC